MNTAPKYWMGTEESGERLLRAIEQASLAQSGVGMQMAVPTRDQMGLEPLYTLQNGVGVVTIAGPLIAGQAGILAFYGGVTGYEDIRAAVMSAITDPEAKSIMLHVSSGGGMVDGCEELGSFLSQASRYKPIMTFADGPMCSAAYWLGSYGSHIITTQTSVLGSLGVLMVHYDKTQMYTEAGIKPTVIRAGKYKALTNPVESLSPEAVAQLQEQADTIYSVFIGAVAPNRKVTYEVADQTMGQGREFMGKAAVKVGLADKLGTYEQALTYAKSLDTSASSGNNSRKSTGASAMKVTLTTAQLAAFSAGATLESLGFNAGDEVETATPTVVSPPVEGTDLTALQASVATLTTERDAFKAGFDAATNASILAQASVLTITAERDALKASQESLVSIARGATGKMLIALGGTDATVATMDGAAIVAEHARASAAFATRFVAGGVASNSKETKPEAKVYVDALQAYMVASGPDALRNAQKRN